MAPRLSPELALLYDHAKAKGNANRATLAVARQAGSVLDGYRSPPEGGQKRIRTHWLVLRQIGENSGGRKSMTETLVAGVCNAYR
jgi:hypothetical protein